MKIKMTKKKISIALILIFVVMFTTIGILQTISEAHFSSGGLIYFDRGTSSGNSPTDYAPYNGLPVYCMWHGRPTRIAASNKYGEDMSKYGASDYHVVSDQGGMHDSNLEASVGYAYYWASANGRSPTYNIGVRKGIQNLIWNSRTWTGSSNLVCAETAAVNETEGSDSAYESSAVYQRANQYAMAYYGILNDLNNGFHSNGERLFEAIPEYNYNATEQETGLIKTYVDQSTNRLRVGPYKLKINTHNICTTGKVSTIRAEKVLYAELTRNNNPEGITNSYYSYTDSFAKYDISTGLYVPGADPVNPDYKFISQDGDVIAFPYFITGEEKEFYVEFNPVNAGSMTDTGNIEISNITYLNHFEGNLHYYGGTPSAPDSGTQEYYFSQQHGTIHWQSAIPYDAEFWGGQGFSQSDAEASYNKIFWYNQRHTSHTTSTAYLRDDTNPSSYSQSYDYVYWHGVASLEFWVRSRASSAVCFRKVTIENIQINLMMKCDFHTELSWIEPIYATVPDGNGGTKQVKVGEKYHYKIIHDGIDEGQRYFDAPECFVSGNQEYINTSYCNGGYMWQGCSSPSQKATIYINQLRISHSTTNAHVYSSPSGAVTNGNYRVPGSSEQIKLQPLVQVDASWSWDQAGLMMVGTGRTIDMELGGHVWLDVDENKDNLPNGTLNLEARRMKVGTAGNDKLYGGILVSLYDATAGNSLVATTITDETGQYRFYGNKGNIVATDRNNGKPIYDSFLNTLHKYFLTFTYNGEIYQPTYLKDDNGWNGEYSNAYDVDRAGFNGKLEKINGESVVNNDTIDYLNTNTRTIGRVFALDQKLQKSATSKEYIAYTEEVDKNNGNYLSMISRQEGTLTYRDVWNKFIDMVTIRSWQSGLVNPNEYTLDPNDDKDAPSIKDIEYNWYNDARVGGQNHLCDYGNPNTLTGKYGELYNWIIGKGVDSSEAYSVVQYLANTLIVAQTLQNNKTMRTYPVYDRFIVGNTKTDILNDTAKDITQAQIVTGAQVTYMNKQWNYLYNNLSDQSRFVDFGINKRDDADIVLQKDAYKATVIVNGKKQEYLYNKKKAANIDLLYGIYDAAGDDTISSSTIERFVRMAGGTDPISVETSGSATDVNPPYKCTFTYNGNVYIAESSSGTGMPTVYEKSWTIDVRASDVLFNGADRYIRDVRPSEYLYDGSDADTGAVEPNADMKNLQVYVTYKITAANMGQSAATINEIVDFYDADNFIFDGTLNGTNYDESVYKKYDPDGNVIGHYVTSYMGKDAEGSHLNDDVNVEAAQLQVSTVGQNGESETLSKTGRVAGADYDEYFSGDYNYKALYVTNAGGPLTGSEGKTVLKPGDRVYLYLTFKAVNTENKNGERIVISDDVTKSKVKLDQNLATSALELGKRNIAEINSYSTYYKENAEIPDTIDMNSNTRINAIKSQNASSTGIYDPAGLVDINSNPGSLNKTDLNDDGDIIASNDPIYDRQQNDTDKAPNVVVKIAENEQTRTITGFVFEDARTEVSSGNSVVGDGLYKQADDKLINGVTIQLVELVQNVDDHGISLTSYNGEKVWASYTYNDIDPKNFVADKTYYRYRSGGNKVAENLANNQVVITGTGALAVDPTPFLASGDGKYAFISVPAGDFYVRYIYGEETDTLLTNSTTAESEEAKIVNYLVDKQGLNSRSYNGQDYKSTVYQSGVDQTVAEDVYHGINMYTNYGTTDLDDATADDVSSGQNYDIIENGKTICINGIDETKVRTDDSTADAFNVYNTVDKSKMYLYNVSKAESIEGASDAKDVYYYRNRSNIYSKGKNGKSLVNDRADLLASATNVATQVKKEMVGIVSKERLDTDFNISKAAAVKNSEVGGKEQAKMVEQLRYFTFGVAQTGIIDTEVEKVKAEANGIEDKDIGVKQGDLKRAKQDGTIGDGEDKPNEEANPEYIFKDVDFGVAERPEAQLKLSKEVGAYKIVLANGQTLFDASKTVKDAYFAPHTGHLIFNSDGDREKATTTDHESPITKARLAKVVISTNTNTTPEIVQPYMDDELIEGSTLRVNYHFTVENVGEVDFYSKDFYYTGKTDNTNAENVTKTNALKLVDYIGNGIKYNSEIQKEDYPEQQWNITTADELIASTLPINQYEVDVLNDTDLINRIYKDRLKTYNTLLTTEDLKADLLPTRYGKNGNISNTDLVVSTVMSTNNSSYDLVYNNLAEIIETSNTAGRRMQYSIVGNQPMADQSLVSNDFSTNGVLTYIDLVTPTEIDADSAQKVLINTPTGGDRNYLPYIIGLILGAEIIAIGTILIRRKMK